MMKRKQRKAAAAVIVLLNLLLLGACAWAVSALVRGPAEASSSSPPEGSVSARPEASDAAPSAGLEEQSLLESSVPADPSLSGLFGNSYAEARDILDSMTVSEKLGQLLLTGVPDKEALSTIEGCQPAGFVLFAKNFEGLSANGVRSMLAEYQSHAKIPMVFAVDEEGGSIVRVSKYPALREKPFPSPQTLYAQGGLEALKADAAEKSAFLLDLGIQLNLAPVCDITAEPSAYIYPRTFGLPAAETAQCVRAVVSAMGEAGISSCLKHFPGYGGNLDTHTGMSVDSRPRETFDTADFLPFQAGIDAGADTVLISHNIVSCMDAELPASLSPEVHRVLREGLGFSGIIVTDDLEMDAVQDYAGTESPAVLALRAGNDLILYKQLHQAYYDLAEGWEAGAISAEQVDAAVLRVLAWKLERGIIVKQP